MVRSSTPVIRIYLYKLPTEYLMQKHIHNTLFLVCLFDDTSALPIDSLPMPFKVFSRQLLDIVIHLHELSCAHRLSFDSLDECGYLWLETCIINANAMGQLHSNDQENGLSAVNKWIVILFLDVYLDFSSILSIPVLSYTLTLTLQVYT